MYYFVVNAASRSGEGIKKWHEIRELLKAKNVEYKAYNTEKKGDARKLAGRICSQKDPDKRAVIVGGDGTLNEFINGVTDFSKLRIGVIPVGSGNDFARGIGLKGKTEDILNDLLEKSTDDETRIDIGRVSYDDGAFRLFVISSGFGLDAEVCRKVDGGKMKKRFNHLHLGKLTYSVQTVRSLFTMKTFKGGAQTDLEAKLFNNMIFCAVMNLPFEGGGVPMAPLASPFDGFFNICIASDIAKWKTFLKFPKLLAAKHEGMKGFTNIVSYSFSMNFDSPVVLHTDGECLGQVSRVSYECLHKKLRVLNSISFVENH